MSLGSDERAAREALRRLINEGLADLAKLTDRLMLADRQINWAFLRQMNSELRRLAEEKSIQIADDALGDLLRKQSEAGWLSVEGASLATLSSEMLDIAISNSIVLVQDILDEGVKLINTEMAKAVAGGKSASAIAATLQKELVLTKAGVEFGIPQWRADLIARSEIYSVYRQAQVASGAKLGFECFVYEGPDDDRTEPICSQYIGQVLTLDEWKAVSEEAQGDPEIIFLYGLHYGCRHELRPVPCPAGSGAETAAG